MRQLTYDLYAVYLISLLGHIVKTSQFYFQICRIVASTTQKYVAKLQQAHVYQKYNVTIESDL